MKPSIPYASTPRFHPRRAASLLLALAAGFTVGLLPLSSSAQTAVAEEGDSYPALANRANTAYEAKEFRRCGDLYDRATALASSRRQATSSYNAACCWALAGEKDRAFASLEAAVRAGWRDLGHLKADQDLESLRDDPRWEPLTGRVVTNQERFAKQHNGELLRMYQEDQGDRSQGFDGVDWEEVSKRDEARRKRTRELLKAGEVRSAEDYFHAAMIFQHGSEAEDYQRAHEMAKKAAELDPEHTTARWLSAAAWDRYLHNTGKPQIYGTQFRKGDDGLWTLEPLDAEAVSDEERAALGVPPLAQARERAKAMNSGS